MANDDPSPKAPTRSRVSRWSPPPRTAPANSNRLLFRFIGIPAVAFAGVLIYRGLVQMQALPHDGDCTRRSTSTEDCACGISRQYLGRGKHDHREQPQRQQTSGDAPDMIASGP